MQRLCQSFAAMTKQVCILIAERRWVRENRGGDHKHVLCFVLSYIRNNLLCLITPTCIKRGEICIAVGYPPITWGFSPTPQRRHCSDHFSWYCEEVSRDVKQGSQLTPGCWIWCFNLCFVTVHYSQQLNGLYFLPNNWISCFDLKKNFYECLKFMTV